MAEHVPSHRTARQPIFASFGVVASQPIRFGVVCAGAYWVFAAVFIFSGRLNPAAFVWLGLVAVAAGIGGWSVALGQRMATPTLVVVGLTVMALPAATHEIPRLTNLLDQAGLSADRGSWLRWVNTGDTVAGELVTPGVLASLLLAVACAVVAWFVRTLPARSARPIHPLIPAAVAASVPIIAAIGPGYDPAVTPFLAGYAVLGFYDVTVTRVWDPPGVVALLVRRWASCVERPDQCPAGFPEDGIFADPLTEVDTHLVLAEGLTVVIQPLQRWHGAQFPDPPQVIIGSGTAFYELLSGWCSGYLPERNPENCGIDHAFLDWIWSPHQAGDSIDQIIANLESPATAPSFPFTQFDDHTTEWSCGVDRHCITAYRGSQGTHLIVDFTLLDTDDDWPTRLYGWWTSLGIRDGKPVLYIDAGRLAG